MIYIIHEETNDNFKIGYTKNNPLSRLASCQTHCPYPVSLLGTFPGDTDKEKEIHRQYFSERTKHNGEWFAAEENEMISLILKEGGELYVNKEKSRRESKRSAEVLEDLLLKVKSLEERNENLKKQLKYSNDKSHVKHLARLFDSKKVSKIQSKCIHSFSTYLYLFINKDTNEEIKVGSTKIASAIGASQDSVLKACRILVEEKMIEKTYSANGQAPIYKIIL